MGIISLLPAVYLLRHVLEDVADKLDAIECRARLMQGESHFMDVQKQLLNNVELVSNTGSFARPLSFFRGE